MATRDGPQEPPSAGHETLRKIRDHLHNDAKEIGDLMVSILEMHESFLTMIGERAVRIGKEVKERVKKIEEKIDSANLK